MKVRIRPRNGSGQFGRSSAAWRNAATAARQFLLRRGALLAPFARLAIDPPEVTFAIAQRGLELAIRPGRADRAGERVARLLPLASRKPSRRRSGSA